MEQPLVCPLKMETLLVCTDGSPNSQGAINAALALAKACQSKVYVLEVLDLNPEMEAQAPLWMPKKEDYIHNYMETIKHTADKWGVPLEYRVRRSDSPMEGILEEAEESKPDLIVMGRRGRSRVFRLMMGNVVARVIGHAPYHILVVPAETPLDFKKVMIASDGSPNSYAAWDEAVNITRKLGCQLIGVSVARDDREVKTAEAVVKKLQTEADHENISLTTHVLKGRPYEAIVQAARDNQVDVIVLGVLGATGLGSLLMGSVTERVIGGAPCPVLVVKESKPA